MGKRGGGLPIRIAALELILMRDGVAVCRG